MWGCEWVWDSWKGQNFLNHKLYGSDPCSLNDWLWNVNFRLSSMSGLGFRGGPGPEMNIFRSELVSCPTRWSLSLIFRFLWWSVSTPKYQRETGYSNFPIGLPVLVYFDIYVKLVFASIQSKNEVDICQKYSINCFSGGFWGGELE